MSGLIVKSKPELQVNRSDKSCACVIWRFEIVVRVLPRLTGVCHNMNQLYIPKNWGVGAYSTKMQVVPYIAMTKSFMMSYSSSTRLYVVVEYEHTTTELRYRSGCATNSLSERLAYLWPWLRRLAGRGKGGGASKLWIVSVQKKQNSGKRLGKKKGGTRGWKRHKMPYDYRKGN